jgi:hypothetical protein
MSGNCGKSAVSWRPLPDDETAVFEDEVDVHLNPKIGSMWMRRGQQAEVVTPGSNVKRYLAGSLHWRTGRLLTEPPRHTTQRQAVRRPSARPQAATASVSPHPRDL